MFRESQQIGVYLLIKRIGRGGFGEVWLAERRAKFVTTKVAVKLPLDEQVDHEAIKQEATLWEQASGHPNILPIIDADEYDGQVVIVSEYAPDGSLEEWLKRNGKMPVEKTVEMMIQILDGLEFLHSRKIIHRDLKPANILLQGNIPRLADFGISRVMKSSLHATNAAGTPYYMAPEAFKRERTVQTDIWSIGVMMYEILKGERPFLGNDIPEIIHAVTKEAPKPLPSHVPLDLQKIILKALAKEPFKRYQTAGEMREDLRRIEDMEAVVHPVPTPNIRTNRLYFILSAVVLLTFAIIGGVYFLTRESVTPPDSHTVKAVELSMKSTKEIADDILRRVKNGEDAGKLINEFYESREAKAKEILRRIKNGEDYDRLASLFSDDPTGGIFEGVSEGQMVPEFEAAALALNPGQVADKVIKTSFGFHIIKLDKKTVDRYGTTSTKYGGRHILISINVEENPFKSQTIEEYIRLKLKE